MAQIVWLKVQIAWLKAQIAWRRIQITQKSGTIAHKGSKEHGEGYKGKRATRYRPKRSGKGANSIKSTKVQQKA